MHCSRDIIKYFGDGSKHRIHISEILLQGTAPLFTPNFSVRLN